MYANRFGLHGFEEVQKRRRSPTGLMGQTVHSDTREVTYRKSNQPPNAETSPTPGAFLDFLRQL
jgi:hypothetical protein